MKEERIESRFPEAADNSLGACPRCKKPVIETQSSYSCSEVKNGCTFRLGKELLGQKILASQLRKLLKNGKTDKIAGFKGSNGLFDTALGYDANQNRYSFVR